MHFTVHHLIKDLHMFPKNNRVLPQQKCMQLHVFLLEILELLQNAETFMAKSNFSMFLHKFLCACLIRVNMYGYYKLDNKLQKISLISN